MNLKDLMSMGLKNLMRRKTRSILAITGVIIGTCAITVMMSLGIGLSQSYEEQLKSFGNLHTIDIYSNGGGMPSVGGTGNNTQKKLDDKTIAEIEAMPYVTAITPIETAYLKIGIGKFVTGVNVVGVRPEVFEKFGYQLLEGRSLNSSDKFALVFGRNVPMWFYNPYSGSNFNASGEAPVDVITNRIKMTADFNYGERYKSEGGEKIEYPLYDGQGVGVLESLTDESSYNVYMNIETVQQINKETLKAQKQNPPKNKEYQSAKVYVENLDEVANVSKTIKDLGLQSFSLSDMLEQMKQTSMLIQAILGGIGAVSMLVAALGISNTMIMSIYERTKEIGVMKVIGANIKDIKKLFLFEAAFIGLIGGFIGIIISFILSALLNTLLGGMLGSFTGAPMGSTISVIPWWLTIATMSFSTGVGILAGYIPAKRAMKLSALESLRNE